MARTKDDRRGRNCRGKLVCSAPGWLMRTIKKALLRTRSITNDSAFAHEGLPNVHQRI